MIVLAAGGEVKGETGGTGQRFERMGDHLRAEGSDPIRRESQIQNGVGPPAHIDDRSCQRLVHGYGGVAVSHDPGSIAKRLSEGLPEHQGGVLHRVVVVDFEVAFGCHLQVEKPVVSEGSEQVIEESDTGRYLGRCRGRPAPSSGRPWFRGWSVRCEQDDS